MHLLAEKLAKLITDEIIVPSDCAWYTLVSSQKSVVDGLKLRFVFKDHKEDAFLLHDFVQYLFTGSFASFSFTEGFETSVSDTLGQNEMEQKQIPTDKKKNTMKKGGNTRKKDVISDEAGVAPSNNKEEGDDEEEEKDEEEEEKDEGEDNFGHLHDYATKFENKISALFKLNKKSEQIRDIVDAVEDDENRVSELEQIFNSSILVSNVMIAALNLVKNAAVAAQEEKVELAITKKKKRGSYENLVKTTFQQLMKNVRKSKHLQADLIVFNSQKTFVQREIQLDACLLEMRKIKGSNDKSVTIDSVLNNLVDDSYSSQEDVLRLYNPLLEDDVSLSENDGVVNDGDSKQPATNDDVPLSKHYSDNDDGDSDDDDDESN